MDTRKKRFYEWDAENGRVEVYSKRGMHLGEYDPIDGSIRKAANPNRNIEV